MPRTLHFFFSIQRTLTLINCVLILGISTPAIAASFGAFGQMDSQSASASLSSKAKTPRLAFISPTVGAMESGSNVTIELKLSSDASKLKVKLNGHDVTAALVSSSCRGQTCTMTGTVGVPEGLKNGENLLRASISVPGAGGETRRISFSYQNELGSGVKGNIIQYYDPASVGISTVTPGGGSPWIQITTGSTTDSANPISDPVASFPALVNGKGYVSIPYPDTQFSTTCTTSLQAIVLDRAAPSVKKASACGESVTEIATSLGTLPSTDLVILGTTSGRIAPSKLDTRLFGGTDYSNKLADAYPQEYMLIGAQGAPASSAHENYSVVKSIDTPYSYGGFLDGTLIKDGDGYYHFAPSGDQVFSITSGSASEGTSVTIGNQKYVAPSNPSSDVGEFWLLVMDRELLRPVNYTVGDGASWTDCARNPDAAPDTKPETQTCGGVFPMDSEPQAGNNLAKTLASIGPRNLVFLVAAGCPFQDASQVPAALGRSVAVLGGIQYSLLNLTRGSQTCRYGLVSVNDNKHSDVLKEKAALSANQYSAQGQSGSLQGFLSRDRSGLYDVAGKAQTSEDPNGGLLTAVDFSFQQIAARRRSDWPLTTSSSLLAAYHDISSQLLHSINETGSNNYDVRYFYTDPAAARKLTDNENNPTTNASSLTQQTEWDKATPEDFATAKTQIAQELSYLQSARGYLTDSGGIGDIFDTSQTPILSNMFAVATDISKDRADAKSQTVDASAADFMDLAAGFVSIIGDISGEELPPISAALGLVSSAMYTASAALDGSDTPQQENFYDITLSDLVNDSSDEATNLHNGFGAAVDNIFTDWVKLQMVGTKTSDSNSGWHIRDESYQTGVSAYLIAGATRSMWLDVLPKLIGTRQFFGESSTDPSTFRTKYLWYDPYAGILVPTCGSVYGTVPPASMIAYPSLGFTNLYHDVIILGEGPTVLNNGTPDATDKIVSSDLAQLLTSTTNPYQNDKPGLNIPPDFIFNIGGPLPASNGATYGDAGCTPPPLGGAEAPSFTIAGPSTGVVGQRVGSYVITPTGQDEKSNHGFNGPAAVSLTGPGNTHLHTNITFHGKPEMVDFRAIYPESGVYDLKITSGARDATMQITVNSIKVEEHVSATNVVRNTPVTLTAKVSANGQMITDGRILFTLNNRTLESTQVGLDGEVSFTTDRLPVGNNRIDAIYRSPRPYGTVEATDTIMVTVIARE